MPAGPMPPMPPVTAPPIGGPLPPHPGAIPPPPVPPGPVPALPLDSTHKTANDACEKRLRQLQVDPAPKVYPKPGEPAMNGVDFPVQTNVFGLEIQKNVQVYQYVVHIKADLSTNKEAVFTKKGKDDFIVLDRHEKCCDIVFFAVNKYVDFFKADDNCLIYDGQSILFSTIDLFEGIREATGRTKLFEINGADLKTEALHTLAHIKMEVYASKNPPVVLSAIEVGRRTADANIAANNRAYQQLMELALNQQCVRDSERYACFEHGKVYFLKPYQEGFEEADCIDVGDGKFTMAGIKKSVQYIEGPGGRGQNNPSLVIDALKAAFHKEELAINKIADILKRDPTSQLSDNERERCAGVIKGLDCHSKYTGRTRHLKIEGIHHLNPATARFEVEGSGSVTVLEYFRSKYGIQLKFPNMNLLCCKERGNVNFYPMELMMITNKQRVTIPQLTSAQSQRTTKECAVLPAVRQRLIMIGKNAAGIASSAPVLEKLGIFVCENPLVANARQLPDISIEYQGRKQRVEMGKWRAAQGYYLRPAQAPAVWASYAVGTSASRFTQRDLEGFVGEFVKMCQMKGIQLGQPAECKLVPVDQIEQKLTVAAAANCSFVFVITDDSIVHVHQMYKLIERNHQMIVQDMNMSKASSVIHKGKRLTLENVINKTNVKLGGINYHVADDKKFFDDQLIIGIGLSAQPAGTKYVMEGKGLLNPVVVGFASNAKTGHEFTGDFLLTSVGQDAMASIEDIIENSLGHFQKSRGTLPKRIVVYRSGVSEGSHGSIIAFEIPLARAIIRKFSDSIKLIYMVVSKDHTFRFFRNVPMDSSSGSGSRTTTSTMSAKPSELNIPPGILLDKELTHPACKQFFLNSHTTLQGTAKTPLYTILADDCNAKLSTLEELTYSLCHHHQIVTLTTSVPTPLYVANEYAKRGRNLWIEKMSQAPIERGSEGSERDRLKEITDDLGYKNCDVLYQRRVNA